MPNHRRRVTIGRVARRLGNASLFEQTFMQDVVRAASPQLRVTRYSRTWRLSRPQLRGQSLLEGKLGFERLAAQDVTTYDEALEDFVTQLTPSEQGSFSHYVLDLERQYMAFEERPPAIRRQSFVGAFNALLNQSDNNLELSLVADEQSFAQWVESVERLQSFRAWLLLPNPIWKPEVQAIRGIMESTNAKEGEVSVLAHGEGPGLDANAPLIDGTVAYSVDGNARFSAVGEVGGLRRQYSSDRHALDGSVVESKEDSSEVIWGRLLGVLRDLLP